MKMNTLNDKIAMVTGAGGGLGRGIGGAIAARLAAEGAEVVVSDLKLENAERIAAGIGGHAVAMEVDVTDRAQVREMVKRTLAKFGRIDILVNNAGGSAALLNKLSMFHETTAEVWDWVINLNLNGTFNCIHAVVNQMIMQQSGKIINIASIAGEVGIRQRVDYSAAKGGVIAMTKALAMELGPYHINVNSISPGMIGADGGVINNGTYLRRSGKPEEVAALAAFLASPDADFITGVNYTIDGGRTLGPKNG
jgi:NAD(P)-dependent dehydrogenase (short-subunit alcohol dehydrogenase family)